MANRRIPVRLIIIDTISRVLAGGDENSLKDVGALVRRLAEQQDTTGAALFDIHHEPDTGITTTAPAVFPYDGEPPKAVPARRMTDNQRNALSALCDLCADHGTPAPAGFGLPAGVVTISVEDWREELFRRGVLDRVASNPHQDFKRLRDGLKARHAIAEKDDLLWSAKAT